MVAAATLIQKRVETARRPDVEPGWPQVRFPQQAWFSCRELQERGYIPVQHCESLEVIVFIGVPREMGNDNDFGICTLPWVLGRLAWGVWTRFFGESCAGGDQRIGVAAIKFEPPAAVQSTPKKGCPARAVSGASGSTCVFAVGGLEVNFSSKLEDTRVEGRSNLSEVARTQAVADLIEFGVVPGVKGFDAELKAAATSLAEHEALEE